jgi:transcriptional regulator with XRE-family HTH domain
VTQKLRQKLLAAKKRKRLSYQELANACGGYSRQYIWRLLGGEFESPKYKTHVVDQLKKVLL